jgi:hypothetical protein
MATVRSAPSGSARPVGTDRPHDVRRPVGWLLIGTTIVNFAAVALLSAVFGWPAVLSEGPDVALRAFAANQGLIVLGFYAFTVVSILLVPISLGLHRLVDPTGTRAPLLAPTVTAAGVLTAIFQTLGWIRWPFVVPDLAATYLDSATSDVERAATASSYNLINAYAGGALGEHLGWLFQGVWGLGIAILLTRSGLASRGLALVGALLTLVWAIPFLLADAVPSFGEGPVALASFAAYSLWFFWNAALGVAVLRRRTATG